MKLLFALLIATILVGSASAAEIAETTNDQNIDQLVTTCTKFPLSQACYWLRHSDTSNKMTEDEVEQAIVNTNSVSNLELQLLKEDRDTTQDRLSGSWNNILSLLMLVLEMVKILYYLLQLFVILHIPYLYVKLMVWFQNMVTSKWG